MLNSTSVQIIKRCDFTSDEKQNLICPASKVNFDSYIQTPPNGQFYCGKKVVGWK